MSGFFLKSLSKKDELIFQPLCILSAYADREQDDDDDEGEECIHDNFSNGYLEMGRPAEAHIFCAK